MLTIAWDVDDVLNALTQEWFAQSWLPSHPTYTLGYQELTQNPPHALLGISRMEYLASLDAFRASHAGRNLAPRQAMLRWFAAHGAAYRHIALTATPRRHAEHVARWVMANFGDWLRVFCFVPSVRPDDAHPVYDTTKGEFLRWFEQADILVDDHPGHISQARELGRSAVLFPQPWNGNARTVEDALAELDALTERLDRS